MLEIPYAPTPSTSGWGHADRHWNCEAIAAGATHRTVPDTVHFLRSEVGTPPNGRTQVDAKLMRPARLWDLYEDGVTAKAVTLPRSAPARVERWSKLRSQIESRLRAQLHDRPRLRAAAQRIRSAAQAFRAAQHPQHDAGAGAPLPEWLLAEWRALHDIEPVLLPTADRGEMLPRHRPTSSAAARVYRQAACSGNRIVRMFSCSPG